MAYSLEYLSNLNNKKLAIPQRVYIGTDGTQYVGTSIKTLKQLTPAEYVSVVPTPNTTSTQAQGTFDQLDESIEGRAQNAVGSILEDSTDIDFTYTANTSIKAELTTTGVVADIYGDDSNVPQITVDDKGRVINIVNVPISTSGGYVQSVANTNTVGLTVSSNQLTANVLYQNTSTVLLSEDSSGLKATFASLNISQFTNDSSYIKYTDLSAGTGISYNNTTGVITNSAPDQIVSLTAGTNISVSGTYPNFTITNTQSISGLVPYTGATSDVDLGNYGLNAKNLKVTGTAGNGDIHLKHQSVDATSSGSSTALFADVNGDLKTKNDGLYYSTFKTSSNTADRTYTFPDLTGTIALTSQLTSGTVTSVAMTVPTGLSITGSPITTSGTLALSLTSGYVIPTTAEESNWNTAYSNRITTANSPLSITSNTISIAQATTSTSGYLSSTDWNTFNNKQSALTNPITGTGTTNEIAYFSGSTALGSLTTATYPSLTELSYVKGVTSAIQTQLDGKQATLSTNSLAGFTINKSVLSTPSTLSNSTSTQNLFPTGQNTFTAGTNKTYDFIIDFYLIKGTTSTNIDFGFSGTAVISNCRYKSLNFNVAYGTNQTAQNTLAQNDPTLQRLSTSSASALAMYRIEGTMRITTSGTVIPQIKFSADPTGTIQLDTNSYFQFIEIGSNTVTTIGTIS